VAGAAYGGVKSVELDASRNSEVSQEAATTLGESLHATGARPGTLALTMAGRGAVGIVVNRRRPAPDRSQAAADARRVLHVARWPAAVPN
jgi:hypothetical protein